jgi:hypothetical protein
MHALVDVRPGLRWSASGFHTEDEFETKTPADSFAAARLATLERSDWLGLRPVREASFACLSITIEEPRALYPSRRERKGESSGGRVAGWGCVLPRNGCDFCTGTKRSPGTLEGF